MIAAALAYAAAGWAIVPLRPGEKRPLIATGTDHAEAATCNVEQVRAWWTEWPEAGIGLVCRAGGFLVIDVDGDEGRETFLAFEPPKPPKRPTQDDDEVEHEGPFPLTTGSRSGREATGWHLIYRVPVGVRLPRSRLLGPGLELKAAGSLVVMPPSLHRSGRRYAWDVPPSFMADGRYPVDPQEPAPWMLEMPDVSVHPPKGDTPPKGDPVPLADRAPSLRGYVGTKYGVKAAEAEVLRLHEAKPGERHTILYQVTARLAELAAADQLAWSSVAWRIKGAAAHAWDGADEKERDAAIRDAARKAGLSS